MLSKAIGPFCWVTLGCVTFNTGWHIRIGTTTWHLYLADAALICALGVWVVALFWDARDGIIPGSRHTAAILVSLTGLALIGAPFSTHPDIALGMATRLLLLSGFYVCIASQTPTVRGLAGALLAGLAVQTVVAAMQAARQSAIGLGLLGERQINSTEYGAAVVALHGQHWLRPYGLTIHPNVLGGFAAVTLVLLACFKPHFWTLLARSLCLGTMLLTLSRGAWLAALVGLGIYVIIGRHLVPRRRRPWLVLGLASLVALGLSATPARSLILARFDLGNPLERQSIGSRLTQTTEALQLIVKHPLIGIGANEYQSSTRGQVVHNAYLLAAAEVGIPGAMLLVLLLCLPALHAWRRHAGSQQRAVAAALAACATLGLVDFYVWSSPQFRLLWIALLGLWAAASWRQPVNVRTPAR